MGDANINSEISAAEHRARGWLAERKFRKARDEFKQLCKRDQPRFLPLLIEANLGLADEMIAKGLIAEAFQVLAYLKTLPSSESFLLLELRLASHSVGQAGIQASALAELAAVPCGMSEAARIRAVDLLLTSDTPLVPTTPAQATLVAEMGLVSAALECISRGELDAAQEGLAGLPRASVLSHWKLFVKGLAAFHKGEDSKALRFFDGLPPGTALDRAATPYRWVLGAAFSQQTIPSEASLQVLVHLAGEPALAAILPKAQQLLVGGNWVDSYQTLRKHLKCFPQEGSEALGILSDFYFNLVPTLPPKQQDACQDYLLELEEFDLTKSPCELLRIHRTLCLLLESSLAPATLEDKWGDYLDLLDAVHGANALRRAQGLKWLGVALSQPLPAGLYWDRNRASLKDGPRAIRALEGCVKLDPENLDGWLRLCTLLEKLGKGSERNRLLDQMTQRFPDEKRVLVLAGSGCSDRKAYKKALQYFVRAHSIDRLDPGIPEHLVGTLYRLALSEFQGGKLDQARQSFLEAQKYLSDQPENFLRNPWCYRARLAVLEQEYGDPAIASRLLNTVDPTGPHPDCLALFLYLAKGGLLNKSKGRPEFPKELLVKPSSPVPLLLTNTLLRVWKFWSQPSQRAQPKPMEEWLGQRIRSSAKTSFTREAAVQTLELTEGSRYSKRGRLELTRAYLERNPKDCLFRLHEWQMELEASGGFGTYGTRAQLESMLKEAEAVGDGAAVKLARQLLAKEAAAPPWDDFEGEAMEEWEEEVSPFAVPKAPPKSPGSKAVPVQTPAPPPSGKASPDSGAAQLNLF